MLSIELIKKACEFAEKFECVKSLAGTYFLGDKENIDYRLVLDSVALNSDCEDFIYKCFLQEVIEGINDSFSTMDSKYLYSIKQDYADIEVYYDYELVEGFDLVKNVINAKEQAIKYVFEH